jgi:hypothetical protein
MKGTRDRQGKEMKEHFGGKLSTSLPLPSKTEQQQQQLVLRPGEPLDKLCVVDVAYVRVLTS